MPCNGVGGVGLIPYSGVGGVGLMPCNGVDPPLLRTAAFEGEEPPPLLDPRHAAASPLDQWLTQQRESRVKDPLERHFARAELLRCSARRRHYMRQLLDFYASLVVVVASSSVDDIGGDAAAHGGVGGMMRHEWCASTARQQIRRIPDILDMFSGREEDLFRLLRAKYVAPYHVFYHFD